MARFSFIIPVYNVSPYLRECLDSILSQDYCDFEVCIVDDGSTDESSMICDEYAARDRRIKLCHQQNGGVSVARNKALEMATGEYIWFVDADDHILPGALEYLVTVIRSSGCDTVFFGADRLTKKARFQYDCTDKDDFLSSHVCYCNPLMIFKREIISNCNIHFTIGMKMGEDLEFQYKYLLHCTNIIAIPYNFYYIRERNDSASRSSASTQNDFLGSRCILLNMITYLENMSYRGDAWMGSRLAERLKCYLKSASRLPDVDRSLVQGDVRRFVGCYRALGYKEFGNFIFRIAKIDVRICFVMYRLLLRSKGLRRLGD
ncbi:MAG: glycosyltransferase family A protein [Bacteroidales bacterium]|nr:glycosyltransferase family A protein [Bacteroidales bacterium]